MSKKYKMMLFTKPVEGRENEYHDWYQNTHLKDVVNVKSVKSAQRFRLSMNIVPGSADPPQFLAIYDIETDDIGRVLKDMAELAKNGGMDVPDTMAKDGIIGAVYEEYGEIVKR
jgi:hypothetical protein